MEEMKDSVTLTNGLTVNDLEDRIMKFIYFVYTPQSEEDIQKGLDSVKDLLTVGEYNTLLSETRYNEETRANMSDLVVAYSSVKNNSDGLDRIYVEFVLTNDTSRQHKSLEFVMNPKGLIFKHYVWNGNTQENRN